MAKHFKQLLLDIHEQSLTEQKRIMEGVFEKWKEDTEQTDDVLVFSMKFNKEE